MGLATDCISCVYPWSAKLRWQYLKTVFLFFWKQGVAPSSRESAWTQHDGRRRQLEAGEDHMDIDSSVSTGPGTHPEFTVGCDLFFTMFDRRCSAACCRSESCVLDEYLSGQWLVFVKKIFSRSKLLLSFRATFFFRCSTSISRTCDAT